MLKEKSYDILHGDSASVLKSLPDECVDMCVTSPPYWNLRSYHDGEKEIGREETPIEYVARLRDVFHEVHRVLKPTGTLWLNLGDCYKDKQLLGMPWRVAFTLQAGGWILRSDIVWCLSGGTYVWARTQKGDMPMMIKDLARLRPESVKLWNGEKWTQLLGTIRSIHREDKQCLLLRSGERIYCTDTHQFPIIRDGKEMLLEAKQIQNGDILQKCVLPEPDKAERPIYLTDDIAWLIGLYMADGSRSDDMLQFALNTGRKNYYLRIREAVEKLGCHAYKWEKGNSLHVNVHGKVINAIIDEFIGGNTAHGKYFTTSVWMLKNECLKKIMEGYLDGDGHFEIKNNRYRIGFCRNRLLERDLRVMAARLDASIVLNLAKTHYTYKGEKKKALTYRGEWRWSISKHWSVKNRCEVVGRMPPRGNSFFELSVADDPHLFSFASGILTHNCKPNAMPLSVKDRCSSAHEYIFMLSKQPSGYYFDYEAIEEPAVYDVGKSSGTEAVEQSLFPEYNESYTEEDTVRIKFGGTKYPNGDNGANSTYSGREYKPKYKNLMADEKGQSNHSFYKRRAEGLKDEQYLVRRKRDVWSIPTQGYDGAHFATFPEKLVEPCILAGCPKDGIVLDCFNGAGTTGVVALKNHRRYLGIELNEEYIKLSRERIEKETAQQTFAF